MELTPDTLVVAKPRLMGADLGEEIILLHLDKGIYFGLGNVAARIWELLKRPVRVGDIEQSLLEEYDVEPEKCREELIKLITRLLEEDLAEVQSE